MKRVVAMLTIALTPVFLFAAPPEYPCPNGGLETPREEAGPYITADISSIQDELGAKKLGDFSVQDPYCLI